MKRRNGVLDVRSEIIGVIGLPDSMFQRLTAVCLTMAFLLFQTGCATRHPYPYHLPPPLSEEERPNLGTIGIVSSGFVPETRFFAHSTGRVSGAAKGMAFNRDGSSSSIFPVPGSSSSGSGYVGGGGVGAILLGLIAAGFIIAGAYRATTWIPAEEVEEIESNLKKALIKLNMQESLKKRFLLTAREQSAFNFVLIGEEGPKTADEKLNFSRFKEMGIDTVIELSVLTIGFEGTGGKDPMLSLLVDAQTRVLRVSDSAALYDNWLQYKSAQRKFTEWTPDNGKLFSKELDRAYAILSEKMVEEIFLRYDIPPEKGPRGKKGHKAHATPTFGLKPVYPKNECSGNEDPLDFTDVDSLQPVFRWESFPPEGLRSDADQVSRMNDIAYDLNIWISENEFPSSLIYSGRGLPEPQHEIKGPLLPCARYFWTVRAQFSLNGMKRASEWGVSAWPWVWQDPSKFYGSVKTESGNEIVRRSPVVPHPNLYRFTTPCPESAEGAKPFGIP